VSSQLKPVRITGIVSRTVISGLIVQSILDVLWPLRGSLVFYLHVDKCWNQLTHQKKHCSARLLHYRALPEHKHLHDKSYTGWFGKVGKAWKLVCYQRPIQSDLEKCPGKNTCVMSAYYRGKQSNFNCAKSTNTLYDVNALYKVVRNVCREQSQWVILNIS
jgi:hypothetical protein